MSGFKTIVRNLLNQRDNTARENQVLLPPDTTSSARVMQNDPTLFADAIYEHLDGKRPFGTPQSLVKKLDRFIKNGLRPGQELRNGTRKTQFENIRATPAQLFNISLGSKRKVTRSQKETELHVLLQSQMQLVDPFFDDHGASVSSLIEDTGHDATKRARTPTDAIPPRLRSPARLNTPESDRWKPMKASQDDLSSIEEAARIQRRPSALQSTADASNFSDSESSGRSDSVFFSPLSSTRSSDTPAVGETAARPSVAIESGAPATPPQRPAAADAVHSFTDRYGNPTRIISDRAVDMQTVFDRLQGISHEVKTISGAASGCWWRGSMLVAITRLQPAALESTILQKLGPDYAVQARQLRDMGEAFRREGLHTVTTGMKLLSIDGDLDTPSRLKLPWITDRDDNGAGEEACMQVVDALLEKVGVPAGERFNIIRGGQMGDLHHICSILNQLSCDALVFSRPWAQVGPDESPRFDPTRSTLEICAQPGSRLANIDFQGDRTADTESVLNETDGLPGLVNKGGHFDFLIPGGHIHLAPMRYPNR